MKRRVSEEEKTLFKTAVEQTRPQVIAKAKVKKPAAKAKAGHSGLDGNTRQRLKRGAKEPEARMDLHGLTQEAAHRALLAFLRRSHKAGLRLSLVITGKGNPKNEDSSSWTMRERGVLKEMVPRWLNEPAFAPLIAGTQTAHVRHGGGGALYVYLRKPE
jgi:DNA-nicking Smr family endonuclease